MLVTDNRLDVGAGISRPRRLIVGPLLSLGQIVAIGEEIVYGPILDLYPSARRPAVQTAAVLHRPSPVVMKGVAADL